MINWAAQTYAQCGETLRSCAVTAQKLLFFLPALVLLLLGYCFPSNIRADAELFQDE